MTEKILIGVAWPYANGPLHLGHIAGAYLPADIFARYHRMRGDEVLMVSGSDEHGTPITIKAEQEGRTPADVADQYHREFLESWRRLGISFDLFTSTGTENHTRVTQDIFTTLLRKGFIYKDTVSQPFCDHCRRFLPDRYVEGTCPYCGYTGARGDQCDGCGKPLNAAELKKGRCRLCGTAPEFRQTEHYFLKLSAFEAQLKEWIQQQGHWRANVLNFTKRYLEEGLHDRAITRDIEWGIPVPVPGFENKRIYVWFEAVIGYLSASKEWAAATEAPEAWRLFWQGETKSYYFIGKDNIVFHTVIWPAMLMGYGNLNLPYDVPANEFLNIEGKKLSTSRNWAVWVPDYLARFQPDPLRYLLSANMPETSDMDFSWTDFVRRNNDELVATYGNLAHRVLTMVQRHFNSAVPEPGQMDARSQALLERTRNTIAEADRLLYGCHFKETVRLIMGLAIKQDRPAAALSLYTAMGVLSGLKTMFYPFLPLSSQKLHEYLGFQDEVSQSGWRLELPCPGRTLPAPEPLFIKLEDDVAAEESEKLGRANT
jgi:methionyl-tRNA synthetase